MHNFQIGDLVRINAIYAPNQIGLVSSTKKLRGTGHTLYYVLIQGENYPATEGLITKVNK